MKKYRAKDVYDEWNSPGAWSYGEEVVPVKEVSITGKEYPPTKARMKLEGCDKWIDVTYNTVGRFSNIYDRNYKQICEDDIVVDDKGCEYVVQCVGSSDNSFCGFSKDNGIVPFERLTKTTIIGNVHDRKLTKHHEADKV